MTREEHMQWCKERALEYLKNHGDASGAMVSMMSNLRKHPETENHIGIQLGMMEMMAGRLSTPDEVRRFIGGFN